MTDAGAGATDGHRWLKAIDTARTLVAAAVFVFGSWSVLTFPFDDAVVRAIFFGFTLAYAFFFFGWRKAPRSSFELAGDIVAGIAGIAVALYIVFDFEEVFGRAGDVTTLDLIVAGIALVVTLEATRRTAGLALPLLSVIFLLYPLLYGEWLPGLLRTATFGLERILTQQYLSLDGILGPAFKVMIEYIFLFIVFGAFLQRFGVTEFFVDFAKAIAGNRRGGSAKVAVLASGLMGTVSGSAVANVVSTGVITIPMMKREGFKPAFAGGVEAAASTGGQIMPPIMGAAAFLMAEFARIPYSQIILHALIPAFLYFGTIWVAVHFEAKRLGIEGESADSLPDLMATIRSRGLAAIPLIVVTVLIMTDYPLADSVLIGIALTVVAAAIAPDLRYLFRLENILGAMRDGVDNAISLFTASACAGIVIGVISLTGLGLKISSVIIDLASGVAIVALLLSALTCLILGLGLPTQIVYLTLAILVAPGLVNMGITTAGAHLFIMYFGMMSMVTPPVCFAAFAAASLANAPMMATGVAAFRLALAGQLIPFLFAFNPGILFIGTPMEIVLDTMRALIALYAAGMAFEIFRLTPAAADSVTPQAAIYLRRALLGIGAALLVYHGTAWTLAGLACIGAGGAIALAFGRGAGAAAAR
ncbi:MAG: TRAP transporter permease [Beijerinckiaceae bacterium]